MSAMTESEFFQRFDVHLARLDGHIAIATEHMARGGEVMAACREEMAANREERARSRETFDAVMKELAETRRDREENRDFLAKFGADLKASMERTTDKVVRRLDAQTNDLIRLGERLDDMHEEYMAQRGAILRVLDRLDERDSGGPASPPS
jgi:chromosome segregation ATPase